MLSVLVVDDEAAIRVTIGDALSDAGCEVETAVDLSSARMALAQRSRDVVVTDIRLPDGSGHELLEEIKRTSPETEVLLITGYGEIQDAVNALKRGAYDYLTKPFSPDELVLRIGRLSERLTLRRELAEARRALQGGSVGPAIVGSAPIMRALFERLEAIADSSASVLILGETGSGKELVAQRLHALSPRAAGPLVPVSCTAFPDSLIEAELFGYERGAFTGATQRRKGRFVAASGGTLFLDEVAEISLPVQAKLLRVLQEPLITPLGTDRPVEVDVRIIAATHQDLKLMVSEGTFREDLYYRLNVLDLVVPPLRQRKSDLAALVSTFVLRYSRDGLEPVISSAAWAALKAHDYPGNVRELAHAIEHACVLSRGKEIQLHHLPGEMTAGMAAVQQDFVAQETLSSAIASYERQYLTTVLRRHGGRRSKAAEALGISRKNLWEKLRNHQLGDKDFIQ